MKPLEDIRGDVPAARRRNAGELLEILDGVFGTVRQVRSPVRVSDGGVCYRRAPARGEDAGGVLGDLLGYDEGRIGELSGGGAFGQVTEGQWA